MSKTIGSAGAGGQVVELQLRNRFKNIEKKLERALKFEVAEIQRRSQSGINADGSAMAKYTPEYNHYKYLHKSGFISRKGNLTKKGRKADKAGGFGDKAVVPNVKPNLTLSGDMWRGIRTKVEAIAGAIIGTMYFTADQAPKAAGNSKKRDFFKLSQEQIDRLIKKLS